MPWEGAGTKYMLWCRTAGFSAAASLGQGLWEIPFAFRCHCYITEGWDRMVILWGGQRLACPSRGGAGWLCRDGAGLWLPPAGGQ